MTGSHAFAGRLVEHNTDALHGLHLTHLRLIDDAGGSHIVMIVHGRGDDAERRADAMHADLHIGERYFGRATMCRAGDLHTYWFGVVSALSVDRRTPPPQAKVAQEASA